jgi:uncharacterized domain HDIG
MRGLKNKSRKKIKVVANILLILLTSVLIVWIFPSTPSFKYDFARGAFWEYDNLIAQTDIVIYKTDKEIQDERQEMIQNNALTLSDSTIGEQSNKHYPLKALDSARNRTYLNMQLQNISPIKTSKKKGDIVIAKGERINADKYLLISKIRNDYNNRIASSQVKLQRMIGQFILVSIALIALLFFFKYISKDIYEDNRKFLLILSVITLMVAITALIVSFNTSYIYIAPLCLTPIIIRTFFDSRGALYAFLVNILIIGFSVPNSFEFVFYQLMVGIMAIIVMERLEKRVEFFRIALLVFITYSVIYVALTLIQDGDIHKLNTYRLLYFGINAALTLFAFPIVYLFERVFGFVSELSLLEYSNTNSKILRELSINAPGTFQHCVQVANLSEDIINQIGGNALLTRVGALHHDIGKIVRPMFFIENQNTGFNPHIEITNQESAEIIIAHVADGVKIASKYKLPEPIIEFIRTHHGTSMTKYFYNQEKLLNPGKPIDESIFSYRGPRPFSRETAVVMMCDSVEAASRSLKAYNSDTISTLVDNIIDGQIAAAQFDNAAITFSDISTIKQLLKAKLQAIYHTRIEYPVIGA